MQFLKYWVSVSAFVLKSKQTINESNTTQKSKKPDGSMIYTRDSVTYPADDK